MRAATPAGASPAHGPGTPPLPKHKATAPATCGAAWLVPVFVEVPPPRPAETTQVPGAAIVCAAAAAETAKFEYEPTRSSRSFFEHEARPSAPGSPSVSVIAVAVSTSR